MHRNPYQRLGHRELTLADYLAIDRTILANERTALAYGRTFLAMLVIGGSCIKFFGSWYMWLIGAAFIAGSFAVATIGWRRFHRTQRYLATALQRRTGTPEHPLREGGTEDEGEERRDAASAPSRPDAGPGKVTAGVEPR